MDDKAKGHGEGIENKWVRDSAIFRWCRVFRLGDSALSSALRFHRSSIPSPSSFHPVPSSLTASYPSLLPLRAGVTPSPPRLSDLQAPSRSAALRKPRQRMCAALNGSPAWIYRTAAGSSVEVQNRGYCERGTAQKRNTLWQFVVDSLLTTSFFLRRFAIALAPRNNATRPMCAATANWIDPHLKLRRSLCFW